MRLKTSLSAVSIAIIAIFLSVSPAAAQSRRKVIIDHELVALLTDQQSMIVLLQSPGDALGITIVSGDMWRDEEVAHTLRMLEIIGRTDVPVYPGAIYPLINREETIKRWEASNTVLVSGAT